MINPLKDQLIYDEAGSSVPDSLAKPKKPTEPKHQGFRPLTPEEEDEENSSEDHDPRLRITLEELERKKTILKKFLEEEKKIRNLYNSLNSVNCSEKEKKFLKVQIEEAEDKIYFTGCSIKYISKKGKFGSQGIEFQAFHKNSSSIRISLKSYPDGVSYLGVSGSPTKFVVGHNLTEAKDPRVKEVQERLKCSEFEALSLVGFFVLGNAAKSIGVENFYSKEEYKLIKAREVSVYAVGFANYVWFTPERDKIFHMLATIATASSPVNRCDLSLAKMLGVKARKWPRKTKDENDLRHQEEMNLQDGDDSVFYKNQGEWEGRSSGLLLQKFQDGRKFYQQMFYLKDQEVQDKKNLPSGVNNSKAEKDLSPVDWKYYKESVRVDNVFYAPYLKSWYNSILPIGEKAEADRSKSRDGVMLWKIWVLFSDKEMLKAMIEQMSVDLGLRSLIFAPTIDAIIEKIETLDEREREWVEEWKTWRPTLEGDDEKFKYSYDHPFCKNLTGKERQDRKDFMQRMDRELYWDLNLPPLFFKHLSKYRLGFWSSVEDDEILSENYSGRHLSKVTDSLVKKVQDRLHTEIHKSLEEIKIQLRLPIQIAKRVVSKKFNILPSNTSIKS